MKSVILEGKNMTTFSPKALLFTLICLFLVTPTLAQTFVSDPVHSYVLARAKHANVGYSFARFNTHQATLSYDATNPSNSSITFSVLAESIDTGVAIEGMEFDPVRRDGHLRSPDFLDTALYPTIDFVSTSVSGQGDMLQVTGNLTLHGVTREVTVDVEKTGEGTNQGGKKLIGFYAEFTINRSDYNMNDIGSIGDEITLMVSLEGVEQ